MKWKDIEVLQQSSSKLVDYVGHMAVSTLETWDGNGIVETCLILGDKSKVVMLSGLTLDLQHAIMLTAIKCDTKGYEGFFNDANNIVENPENLSLYDEATPTALTLKKR